VTLREALRQAEARIASHNIPDARVEAELLLMDSLGIQRAEIYARLGEPFPSPEGDKFWGLVERRLRREPTAYILRRCEFYGIELYVDPRVLIPRPETELLVETALAFVEQRFGKARYCTIAARWPLLWLFICPNPASAPQIFQPMPLMSPDSTAVGTALKVR
jgi:HemK-like putative methylase